MKSNWELRSFLPTLLLLLAPAQPAAQLCPSPPRRFGVLPFFSSEALGCSGGGGHWGAQGEHPPPRTRGCSFLVHLLPFPALNLIFFPLWCLFPHDFPSSCFDFLPVSEDIKNISTPAPGRATLWGCLLIVPLFIFFFNFILCYFILGLYLASAAQAALFLGKSPNPNRLPAPFPAPRREFGEEKRMWLDLPGLILTLISLEDGKGPPPKIPRNKEKPSPEPQSQLPQRGRRGGGEEGEDSDLFNGISSM